MPVLYGMIVHCVIPEKIHTHSEEGYWNFQGGGGGRDLKAQRPKCLKEKFTQKLALFSFANGKLAQ